MYGGVRRIWPTTEVEEGRCYLGVCGAIRRVVVVWPCVVFQGGS